jgi:hypothetical protein
MSLQAISLEGINILQISMIGSFYFEVKWYLILNKKETIIDLLVKTP